MSNEMSFVSVLYAWMTSTLSHLLIHVNNDDNDKLQIFSTQIASSSVEDAAATRPGSLSARTRVPGRS